MWGRKGQQHLGDCALPACLPLSLALGVLRTLRVPPNPRAAVALVPSLLLLKRAVVSLRSDIWESLGMCPGLGPAHDAGAWQLRPFQLCAQSRNSPGIEGRGKRAWLEKSNSGNPSSPGAESPLPQGGGQHCGAEQGHWVKFASIQTPS